MAKKLFLILHKLIIGYTLYNFIYCKIRNQCSKQIHLILFNPEIGPTKSAKNHRIWVDRADFWPIIMMKEFPTFLNSVKLPPT